MAKTIKPLTDSQIKKAPIKDKDYKLFDGQGLHLLVKTNGSKLFRMIFKYNQKATTMSFGKYPLLSLKEAREKREEILELLKDDIDPRIKKKKEKEQSRLLNDVFKEWIEVVKDSWAVKTKEKNELVYNKNIFPYSGKMKIEKIESDDIIKDIDRIQARGSVETADRLLTQLNRIFKYAVTRKYCKHNIIADIDKKAILKPIAKSHFPAITKKDDIKKLINDINSYRFNFASDLGTAIALEIAPFVVLRPYNLRTLEKTEINIKDKQIEIPANKMKTKEDFIMPITDNILEKLLEAINLDYRNSIYVFPSPTSPKRPISDNTLNMALKRMGYAGIHTVHGFRSTFSTNMNILRKEHGYESLTIEVCLAHSEKDKIKAAYDRADKNKYLEEKRGLIQWYENWIINLSQSK